jgi:predicted TIM-barrel fold metal-dependent hydrolase
MILVSVDDHVVEPPDMFAQHLPAKWKDAAPRVEHRDDGTDVWVYEATVIPNIGLNAVAGRPKDEYGIEPTSFDEIRPGCFDIHERIQDMNAAGVLGSMNFPSYPGFAGRLFAASSDLGAGLAILKAYNDWHVDEWCGTYPGRMIPLALPVLWDPDLAAEEVRRVAAKGCHAVTFSENPECLGFPSLHNPHWDPFWTACSDTGTVVCMHIGSSGRLAITAQDAPVDVMITLQPMNIVQCAADLLWSPVLRKYPDLRFALSEGGIGWIPYFLDRVDRTYEQHHLWTGQDFGDTRPSQLFQERIITCFIDDPVGVVTRHFTGIDTITWECDYPHSDSTWPYPGEQLQKALHGVPDDEIDQITHRNAMRHFRFDPFAVRPRERCTVGALRAESAGRDVEARARGKKLKSTDGILTGAAVQAQATA